MSDRYYLDVPERPEPGKTFSLSTEESRHLTRVMRAKVGDSVVLFNGRGLEFESELVAVQKGCADIRILRVLFEEAPATVHLTIAAALPKGDRQKMMVEKLTELSVSRIIPLATRYSLYKAETSTLLRLRRQAVEAAKQCGRRWLPEITEECRFDKLDTLLDADTVPTTLRLFAHPVRDGEVGQCSLKAYFAEIRKSECFLQAAQAPWSQHSTDIPCPPRVVVVIGPTGGFAPEEVEAALAAGWQPLELGSNVLRTETAAMAVAAGVLLL